ncbi:MAG: hypothetical protein LEGION0398_MBIBDBAK_00054 [Legionellaceae bacterium]
MFFLNTLKKGLIFISLLSMVSAGYANPSSPIGKWKTIDDKTHQPRSIVDIKENQGTLEGKIEQIFTQPNEDFHELCDKCPGKWYNQKKIGMVFLWGFSQSPKNPLQWINGKILDPKTGKIYECQLTLSKTGKQLKVRGYIGIPLFGRTQKWLRID